MGLKEFLRPTRWKILILVMLGFLAYFGPIIGSSSHYALSPYIKEFMTPFILFLIYPLFMSHSFSYIPNLIFVLVNLIYLYVLSCLISFIVRKCGEFNKKLKTALIIILILIFLLGCTFIIYAIFFYHPPPISGSLKIAELGMQPTADKPVTIGTLVNIKFKGQRKMQIGFYNFKPQTLYTVTPKIFRCMTANAAKVSDDSLPAIQALPKDEIEAGNAEGWDAIVDLKSDKYIGNLSSTTTYTGALPVSTYICNIGIYACTTSGCSIDLSKDLIKSANFTLQVTG